MQINFAPLSPNFAKDPYAVYRQLREANEPFYFEAQDMWLLSRYEDVKAVATNPAMVRSLEGYMAPEELAARQLKANWHDMPYHERVVQFSLLDSDGEIHRRLRKQVFGAFTGRALAILENNIRSHVEFLLSKQEYRFDFIANFAAHIPGYIICKLLGAPVEDRDQLRLWSEQIVQFFDIDRSDERKLLAETATREFYHYLADLKRERNAKPGDDLISKMIEQERAGGFVNDDEFISTCMLILMAGHGSTIDALGSGMHLLLKHPGSLKQLRQKQDALPSAIQEMFRLEPPLPFFHRHATIDIALRGHEFKKGTTFGLLYAAANRDPAAFNQPDIFDIDRSPNRHLAFGQGAHLCLGNNLARINMRIVFETLLSRFKTIDLLEDEVTYKRGLSVRGPQRLMISVSQ